MIDRWESMRKVVKEVPAKYYMNIKHCHKGLLPKSFKGYSDRKLYIPCTHKLMSDFK